MNQLEDDVLNGQLENRNASLCPLSLSLSSALCPLTGLPWANLNTPKLLKFEAGFCKQVSMLKSHKCFMNVEEEV